MASGVVEPERVAVLRGRVLERMGTALEGVSIRVWHGSEYGETTSRRDGLYDLAVNGGGSVTLEFDVAGKLFDARNVFKYGNSLGPSANHLFGNYGTWEGVIAASGRTNAFWNMLGGL